jgi:hypothetical protein
MSNNDLRRGDASANDIDTIWQSRAADFVHVLRTRLAAGPDISPMITAAMACTEDPDL